MKRKHSLHTLREAAYRFLGTRARTRLEMQRHLTQKSLRWQLNEEYVSILLEELQTEGLLNNSEFSQHWVESKRTGRAYGPQRLRMQLLEKGVSAEEIHQAFNEVSEEQWFHAAITGLTKFLSKKTFNTEQERKDKAMGFLLRRGFSAGMARRAFDAVTRTE